MGGQDLLNGGDSEGRVVQGGRTIKGQHPFQQVVDVRQVKNDSIQIEDYEESDRQLQDRSASRLGQRRQEIDSIVENKIVDSYQYYGEEESNRQPIPNQKGQSSKKKTNIEVLDDEQPIEAYKQQHEGDSESGDLLKKLIENINNNPALKNQYIKDQFKLDLIQSENDLHEYKNLLNSMAALFYTNHRMNDVTLLFYMWKEAAIQKLQAKQENQKKDNSKPKKVVPPLAIQIDTELAN